VTGEAPRGRGHRYPLHELEALIGWPTAYELAAEVGTTVEAVKQWKIRGLSHRQADQLASHFDYHPTLVWGPVWDQMPTYPTGTPESELRPKRERPAYGLGSVAELCERASRRRFQNA
jgi:hypothetical protein